MQATQITAATRPAVAARAFVRYALENGGRIWASDGYRAPIEGWVLTIARNSFEIRDAVSGEIRRVSFGERLELVEAT